MRCGAVKTGAGANGFATGVGAGATATGAAATGGALFRADSISARTIRPPGPDPVKAARSTPACDAIRRAKGEATTRSPAARGTGAAATTTGAAAAA